MVRYLIDLLWMLRKIEPFTTNGKLGRYAVLSLFVLRYRGNHGISISGIEELLRPSLPRSIPSFAKRRDEAVPSIPFG